ncbi:MAG: DUF2249 domain-containing protein, partial [Ktedonobacterales bacterium]
MSTTTNTGMPASEPASAATLSPVTKAISAHHRELGEHLAAEVAALEQNSSDGAGLVRFLTAELLPHAAGEEQRLYPIVNTLIVQHGTPTATMSLDHAYIESATKRIETLTQQAAAATDVPTREALRRQLVRAAVQIEAVVSLHTDKEERAYLPLVARYQSEDEQRHLLEELHATAAEHAATGAETAGTGADTAQAQPEATLDVRMLPPAQRHALIFRTFDTLVPGAGFVLVNDHDPKPLYYQLNFEHQGELAWEYIEEGPEVWQVRIGKTRKAESAAESAGLQAANTSHVPASAPTGAAGAKAERRIRSRASRMRPARAGWGTTGSTWRPCGARCMAGGSATHWWRSRRARRAQSMPASWLSRGRRLAPPSSSLR